MAKTDPADGPRSGSDVRAPSAAVPATPVEVDQRKQFIIAPRRRAMAMGFRPMSATAVRDVIGRNPNIEVIRVIKPSPTVAAMSLGAADSADTLIAKMHPDQAELLKQSAPPSMIVEEDAPLHYGGAAPTAESVTISGVGSGNSAKPQQFTVRVVDENNQPVAGVPVTITADGFPAEDSTDAQGLVTLDVYLLPGSRPKSLFVRSSSNYWDHYTVSPQLKANGENIVRVRSLKATVQGFPEKFRFGWGQRLMGLDRVGERLTAHGVKVCITDSGADTTHPALAHITRGVDLTNPSNPNGWTNDVIGHGSHCAGVVAASGAGGGFRGFAPGAEVHIAKIFPEGRFSTLLDALDYCIQNEIDLVNMSLGSPQVSQAIEEKLEEAAHAGVACIVAAGNSGGPVQYPASSDMVLSVAAIGRLREFPEDTWDQSTVQQGYLSQDGLFSPSFTCFGPQIRVAAPGVAIISTVPGNAFDAQSGTSMAAPHVTGLAALLLAHHPIFKGELASRDLRRVAGLFQLLVSTCRQLPFGAERGGAGVPGLTDPLIQAMLSQSRPSVVELKVPPQAPAFAGVDRPGGWNGGVPQSAYAGYHSYLPYANYRPASVF